MMTKGPYGAVRDQDEVYVYGDKDVIIAFCDNEDTIPKKTQVANAKGIANALNAMGNLVRKLRKSRAYKRRFRNVSGDEAVLLEDVIDFLRGIDGTKPRPEPLPPRYLDYTFGTKGSLVLGLHVTKTRVCLTGRNVGLPASMSHYISYFTFTVNHREDEFDKWREELNKRHGISIPRAELLVDSRVRIPFNPPGGLKNRVV
jgi:hypothetical protein